MQVSLYFTEFKSIYDSIKDRTIIIIDHSHFVCSWCRPSGRSAVFRSKWSRTASGISSPNVLSQYCILPQRPVMGFPVMWWL